MAPLTPQDLRIHPHLVRELHARARRARAEAIHSAVVGLFSAMRGIAGGKSRRVTLPLSAHWG